MYKRFLKISMLLKKYIEYLFKKKNISFKEYILKNVEK